MTKGKRTQAIVLEDFKAKLAAAGLKYTKPREDIFLLFLGLDEHVSADDLLEKVRKVNKAVGLATVHRTLRLLVEAGYAVEHRFGGRRARYEPALGREHHDHLICTACGRIVEFEEPRIEALQKAVADTHGFSITDHRLELFGRCPACQDR